MSNYSAVVVKITNLRPHTNADRLVCTNIFGNNIIVGKETKVGDLGLYFPLESQLGEEFARANDLIRRKDENGKTAGGMFDDNRRVRAQTFRGEKSEGFWIPIESLNNLFPNGKALDMFEEGQEIEEYLGKPIATKYIPKRTTTPGSGKRKEGRKPRVSRIIPDQFRFHFDTPQLGRNLHKLSPTDYLIITHKWHGTSAICGNVLVKTKSGVLTRIASLLGIPVRDSKYDYIFASRRVIKNEFEESKQHFYSEDLWTRVGKELFEGKLYAGETVYYEIVGFTKEGKPIQGGYDYGCAPGEYKALIYRITRTAPDGTVTELSWQQVEQRAVQLGVPTVPVIFSGWGYDFQAPMGDDVQFAEEAWRESVMQILKETYVNDSDCQFCKNKVPAEGICVRKDGLEIEVFKLKNFRFLAHETKLLDKGEVDTETAESC